MPELPEVETTLRGLSPHVSGQLIERVVVRNHQLRWPVPANLNQLLVGQRIQRLFRRAKYLLWQFSNGHLLMHLGMSGSMRMVSASTPAAAHDHIDIHIQGGQLVRFTDPRRFGAALWVEGDPLEHSLLCHLGPEPLSDGFDGELLFKRSRRRKVPIKTFIMDNKVVVGVGNIYANEALFASGIHPLREVGGISRARYKVLAQIIKEVLAKAITQGGTTLKDFVGGDGKPGYFAQQLNVYGRAGEPCVTCGKELKEVRIGQRSTVYCRFCQR